MLNLDTIVWPDVILGLIIGALIVWLIMWFWDSRQRRRDAAEYAQDTAALQQSLDNTLVEKSTVQHELSALQDAHSEVLSRNDSLDDLVQQFQTKQASLEQEMSDSRTQLRKMASIQQANDTLRNKLNSAEARSRELSGQLETVGAEAQTLPGIQNELEQARSRIEQLEADKLTLRDKLAHTETEIATMGAEYSANADDMGELALLREQNAQAQREIEHLRNSQTTSTADSERVVAMRKQVDELEARLESAEEALLHEQNRVVAAEVKLQTMADKLTDERLRAEAVENELDSLRSGKATANTARMRAEMAAQQSEIQELRTKLNNETLSATDPQATTVVPPPAQTNGSTGGDQQAVAAAESSPFPTWVRRANAQRAAAKQPSSQNPAAAAGGKRDRLQLINGIGNVFAARLQQAGIDSFAKLGQLTPDQASDIVRAKAWQAVDATSWIEQARQLAASGDKT